MCVIIAAVGFGIEGQVVFAFLWTVVSVVGLLCCFLCSAVLFGRWVCVVWTVTRIVRFRRCVSVLVTDVKFFRSLVVCVSLGLGLSFLLFVR